MSLKATLKKYLPAQVRNMRRAHKSKLVLNAVPRLSFPTHNLRAMETLSPQEIWCKESIENNWQEDFKAISLFLKAEDLAHGVNPGDRRALYYLVKTLRPQRFLEIGTHIGMSTLFIARAMRSNGGGHITSVDIYDVNDEKTRPWERYNAPASPRTLLEKADCADMVTFRTDGALDYMHITNDTYDMVFLDGNHAADAVYQEMSRALELLNPGGIILLHDVYPKGKPLFRNGKVIHGPWLAAKRLHAEVPELHIIPLGNLPWPTKLDSHATTLALALRG